MALSYRGYACCTLAFLLFAVHCGGRSELTYRSASDDARAGGSVSADGAGGAPPLVAVGGSNSGGRAPAGTGGAASVEPDYQYIKAEDGEREDFFGGVLAFHGRTLVVAATGKDPASRSDDETREDTPYAPTGAVYVYSRTDQGDFEQQALLQASRPDQYDLFGASVAIDSGTIAVGSIEQATPAAPDTDGDSSPPGGEVYVFEQGDTTWDETAYIKPPNPNALDAFGSSVALWGDTLAVGAYAEDSAARGINADPFDDRASDSGAVYIYRKQASGQWLQEAYLKASNADPADRFGFALALHEDTLVVGANLEDGGISGINGDGTDNALANSGAVYVFIRRGDEWSQQAYLKGSPAGERDGFGTSMALFENWLVVGSPEQNGSENDLADGTAPRSGAAYLFHRGDDGWNQEAVLKAPGAPGTTYFGGAIAIGSHLMVVGALGMDRRPVEGDRTTNRALVDAGAAFVYRPSTAGFAFDRRLEHRFADHGDMFGVSVAVAGPLIAVGSHHEDGGSRTLNGDERDNQLEGSGAVFVFDLD